MKPPPRSILKPTMPQLPDIPPHKSKSYSRKSPPSGTVQGLDKLPNPFQNDDSSSSGTKIALRTEEEQQAAAREREEREREEMEKEIKDRREARRKSLANRRVSFAAEATLHTFHEIEEMHDSTSSTDPTRRASSMSAQPPSSFEASDPPSTPPDKIEDLVLESPEDQRKLHQKTQRRSSGVSALDYNSNQDDLTLASSIYSSDSEATDGITEVHEEIGSDSGSDSDADGVTMDLDVDDMTGTSVASAMSARSGFTDDENDTLDDALRQATRRAETQRIDAEEEIIPSFGWVKKPGPKPAGRTREQENHSNPTIEDPGNDATMEMDITKAVGGIIIPRDDTMQDLQEAEISMDVTRALGGILPSLDQPSQQPAADDCFEDESVEDATMELTMAIGGIRDASLSDDFAELDEDEDMSMELTTVMGGVVSTTKTSAVTRRTSLARRRTLAQDDETAMDVTVGLGRIISAEDKVETPKGTSPQRSGPAFSFLDHGTPSLPSTPKERTAVPKSTNTTPRSSTKLGLNLSLFQHDPSTGTTTPQVLLTPQRRQLSGVGADRSGLGSPKVTAILERRASISDSATLFTPRENFRAVSFADPQILGDELDRERQEEHAKESGFAIEGAVDGDDDNNTASLKDMISSMTPKKNPLKGRKSLHVGSASGLLGKRPTELDDEDDDHERDGVKRLKNHQGSPVKNVRLRAPPSKEETTGRAIRSPSRLLDIGSTNISASSPAKGHNLASSPQGRDGFQDVPSEQPTSTFTLHDNFALPTREVVGGDDGEHIHLQDFLNLTSIRFMELTTTKRRHTQAPTAQKDVLPGKEDLSLERCIVAGACTVPMLELYQHVSQFQT